MVYTYEHPVTLERKDVVQGINDEHVYEEDGVKWNRVWNSILALVDTECDPFDSRKFLEKTNKKGSLGDLWDRSKELSEKRAAKNGGIDPIKDKTVKTREKFIQKEIKRKNVAGQQ